MQTLGKTEKAILFVVFAGLVAAYGYWIHFRFPLGHGDNAFFAQMLDRMAETGLPYTQVAEAVRHLFVTHQPFILGTPAEQICQLKLPGPGPAEFNFFRWHAYLDLYLYLPLFWIAGGELGMSLLTATSFLMVVAGAYVLLRKHSVPIVLSGLVAALLALHPVWAGGVLGQFYGDRLWIGPAFVLCALLLTRRFDSPWVIPLAILLTLTSERMGMVVGALLIGSIALTYPRQPREWWNRRSLLVTAVLSIAFSSVVLRSFSENIDYGTFFSTLHPAAFLASLKDYPGFAANLMTFLEINLVAWGLPALWSWRGLLLSLGVMIPNIMGNYGGAEKVSFLFHYHSLYFPVLMAAICVSFLYVYKRYPRWASWAFVGWLGAAGLAFNFQSSAYDFRVADLPSRSLSWPFRDYAADSVQVKQRRELAAYMDQFPNTQISTGEAFFPLFYRHHRVAYYPLGIDDSDFVVVSHSGKPGVYGGAFSYLGDEREKLNECLTRRLLETGYRVQKEVDAGIVLTRRKE